MRAANVFLLDEEGLALLLKLIYRRMEMDITSEHQELIQLQAKQNELSQKSGLFNSLNKMHKDQAFSKVQERLLRKQAWRDSWSFRYMEPMSESLKPKSAEDLIVEYLRTPEEQAQLFLIVQEAILTPLYQPFDKIEGAGEEKDPKESVEEISRICGLEKHGKKIVEGTADLLKEMKLDGSSLLEKGIYAFISESETAAALAMPGVAQAIGGVLGRSGTAAAASGIVMLAGGSIAVGRLGEEEGPAALIGGSGIEEAVASGACGSLLNSLALEVIGLQVSKTVNYIRYLQQSNSSVLLLEQAQQLFLDFKQQAEREMVINRMLEKKKALHLTAVLTAGLKAIL
ncbi:hypothetical protein [Paenibacillus protaetiae]|uniref:Uncharacterized protein n=1 Tax=Paenibacillus protaetiae TaxID=2509456 RepID=A0A4P6EWJ6_9BACL|nr:hypothetical protein [Paenibacillus protaetiae]QAY66573.1 hypothetical protein ET464_09315 [Paenibacillus protaetiae]